MKSAVESSPYATDSTLCPICGHAIGRYDYSCDALGRTIEVCPVCGPRLLILKVGAHRPRKGFDGSSIPKRMADPCVECGETFQCSGVGYMPERCPRCSTARKEAQRVRHNQTKALKRKAGQQDARPRVLNKVQQEAHPDIPLLQTRRVGKMRKAS
jgi:phage FluMu protein Com